MRPIDADALFQEMIKTIANMMRTRRWMRRDESNEEEILSVIQNAPTLGYAPKWISVKDRLPNTDGEYLVFQHGYSGYKFVRTASFNVCYSGIDDDMHGKTVWYDYDSECGDYELIGITHWMPLPEPPKEE